MKLEQYTTTTIFCRKKIESRDGMYIIPPDIVLFRLNSRAFFLTPQGCHCHGTSNWDFRLKDNHTIVTSSSQAVAVL